MRISLYFFIGILSFGGMVSSVHATEAQETHLNAHLCSQEIPLFITPEYKDACAESKSSAETVAEEVLAKEVKDFQEEDLAELLQDNGSNGHFIAKEAIKRLRSHESCLENICDNWFLYCANRAELEHSETAIQVDWCDTKREQLSKIARTELVAITTQNQTRKNRSLLFEKFRQISSRFRYYLHFWMSETATDMNFFKGKVDGTIRQPR